jgi:aspartate aminotransferase-like enzyme
MLRYAWQTTNPYTFVVSGTGTAAMEAAVCNVIEPGDTLLVFVTGYFGERLCDMGERYGAVVTRVDIPWGNAFTRDAIAADIRRVRPSVVAIVHAETSTGVRQALDGVCAAVCLSPSTRVIQPWSIVALWCGVEGRSATCAGRLARCCSSTACPASGVCPFSWTSGR